MFNRTEQDLPLKTPGSGVDFHMHTLASDGLWSPETLVETAVEQGLKVMTVSDHDTIANVEAVGRLAAQHGIRFVPGVEITVNWKGATHHMLCFNYDPQDAGLNQLLNDTQAAVEEKKREIIDGLHKRGYRLSRLDEVKKPDGTFLPIDIPKALLLSGEVANMEQAYNVCWPLGLGRVCSQPADRAIEVALSAGGLPVIAHPGRSEVDFTPASTERLRDLVEYGLGGLEVYHYSHGPAEVELYRQFAREHNLVISAGSDSHSAVRKPAPWNPELTRALLERLDVPAPTRAS